jgi:hypothetical protein
MRAAMAAGNRSPGESLMVDPDSSCRNGRRDCALLGNTCSRCVAASTRPKYVELEVAADRGLM